MLRAESCGRDELLLVPLRNIMRFYPRASRNGSCACTCVYHHIGICPYRPRRHNSCAFSPSLRIFFNCARYKRNREISNKIEYGDIAVRWKCQRLSRDLLTYFIFQLVSLIAVITMLSTSALHPFLICHIFSNAECVSNSNFIKCLATIER